VVAGSTGKCFAQTSRKLGTSSWSRRYTCAFTTVSRSAPTACSVGCVLRRMMKSVSSLIGIPFHKPRPRRASGSTPGSCSSRASAVWPGTKRKSPGAQRRAVAGACVDRVGGGNGFVARFEAAARHGRHHLHLHRLLRARKPAMQVRRRRRDLALEVLSPGLMVRGDHVRRGVILIDPHHVGRVRPASGKNFIDIPEQPPRLAVRLRRPIERMAGLQHVGRYPMDIVGARLPGGEQPPAGPARMPRARRCCVPGTSTGRIAWGVVFFVGGGMLAFRRVSRVSLKPGVVVKPSGCKTSMRCQCDRFIVQSIGGKAEEQI
jgi:hypothetical protein